MTDLSSQSLRKLGAVAGQRRQVDALLFTRGKLPAAAYVSRDIAMDLHSQRVSSRLRIVLSGLRTGGAIGFRGYTTARI